MAQSKTKQPIKIIDLFAGAGGLSCGFIRLAKEPFHPVWANDFNRWAVETYNANFGHNCELGDIVDLLQDKNTKIPTADIVIGGPPCQGFSLLNKNRENDPRKALWIPYLDIIDRSQAKVFVMENVPQLLGSDEYLDILEKARTLGFNVTSKKLCAADYGVPQVRHRAFIVGAKNVDPNDHFPPKRTHFNPKGTDHLKYPELYVKNPQPWVTVRNAIADLPAPEGIEIRDEKSPLDLHFGRTPTAQSLARYKAIPNEGMNRFDLQRLALHLTPKCWINKKSGGTDLFGRLWWDKPSVTVRTEFFKPEKGRYLHPQQHRPITHREAARFQSFPDDFKFVGTKIEIAKQIGNAVPPLLAKAIADAVTLIVTEAKSSRTRTKTVENIKTSTVEL